MKNNYIYLLLCLTIVSFESYAQQLDLRAFAGVNILHLANTDNTGHIDGVEHSEKIHEQPGYQIGGAITYGKRFYVQSGVQWTKSSIRINNVNTQNDEIVLVDEFSLNMLSIPAKVGFKLIHPDNEDIFNFRIYTGVYGNYIFNLDHSPNSGKLPNISDSDYNDYNANADFGIGVDLFKLYFDTGYQVGLTSIYEGVESSKGNTFYANFGVRFALGENNKE